MNTYQVIRQGICVKPEMSKPVLDKELAEYGHGEYLRELDHYNLHLPTPPPPKSSAQPSMKLEVKSGELRRNRL